MKNVLFVVAALLLVAGCVQMRDYTGGREGAYGLDIKHGFDQGVQGHDYYVISETIALIERDTKDEVTQKIGAPDSIESTIDDQECWIYKEHNLKLFFNDQYLSGWKKL